MEIPLKNKIWYIEGRATFTDDEKENGKSVFMSKDVKLAILEYLEYLELSKPHDKYSELYQIMECDIRKFKKIFGEW